MPAIETFLPGLTWVPENSNEQPKYSVFFWRFKDLIYPKQPWAEMGKGSLWDTSPSGGLFARSNSDA
jgi:hypothetical protein